MSKSDWEFLQIKAVRALFLAVSSVFVVLYGCYGTALANEYEEKERAVLVSEASPMGGSEAISPEAAVTELAEVDPVAAESVAVESTSAEDLEIPARFGASFETSHNGFDDIVSVNGFMPLDQTAGEDITFLEGDVQLVGDNLSGSLNIGHRSYDLDDDVINGGYLGVDARSTDNSTFYQLAAGYEYIEEDWELRANGYLPIGSRRNTLRSSDDDSGVAASSGFVGNQLVLSSAGERQRILQQENALGGLDVEVGTQLDEWYGGELRGYLGAYYLSGKESSLGVQGRIAADFESNFNAGVSLQHDGLFGTSVGFSVSASLPGVRFHGEGERAFQEENEVVIRLRDPIVRRPNVAVNMINESETITVDESAPLRNPEEEEDYRFVHVDLAGGAGAGDGTYENPFGAVEDAIALLNTDADTFSDGNTVVYVDGESAPATTIPSFTVPDRVRVLSQGPQQTIAGMTFPGFSDAPSRLPFSGEQNFNVASESPNANGITVLLPDSGDGVFPVITGGAGPDLVTLNNSTVLAGFNLQGATNNGVSATGVNNVELRNNLIEGSGGSGVSFNNVGGNIVLLDNEINGSGDRGILIDNRQTDFAPEVIIAGFDLEGNRVGIDLSASAIAGEEFPSQRIVIGPSTSANTSSGMPNAADLSNTVANSTDEGIIVQSIGDGLFSSNTQEAVITETTVENSGGVGIRFSSENGAHSQELTISDSTVRNSGDHGIEIDSGDPTAGLIASAAVQEFVLRDSIVELNAGNGIDVSLANSSAQELVIRGNQIINNTGDGIRSIAQDVSIQEWRTDANTGDAGISENQINGNGGQAIVIDLEDFALLPITSVVNNDLSGNTAGPDLAITSISTPGGSAAACLIISDNLAPLGVHLTGADLLLTGDVPSIKLQDLAALRADDNFTFFSDRFGTVSEIDAAAESSGPFVDDARGCIP